MERIVFGKKTCGIQGMFFFETKEEGIEYGEDIKRFLKYMRSNENGSKEKADKIIEKYSDERMLKNFLIVVKERCEIEDENPSIWAEKGIFHAKDVL